MKGFLGHGMLLAAAALALGLSVLLGLEQGVPGCGPAGGCVEMHSSRWASVFGLPISIPAAIIYGMVAVLGLAVSPARRAPSSAHSLRADLLVFGSWLILASAGYFVALQAFVIRGFCGWCLAIHALAAAGASILLRARPERSLGGSSPDGGNRSRATFPPQALLAVLLVGGLGMLQAFGPAPGQSRILGLQDASRPHGVDPGMLVRPFVNSQGAAGLALDGGEAPLFAFEVPRIRLGDPEEPRPLQVAVMSDWTCADCRLLHGRLDELFEPEAGSPLPALEIYLLPVFFDDRAEEVHRAMLLVHFISGSPDTFGTLARELVSGDLAPDASALRQRAFELEPDLAGRWDGTLGALAPRFESAFNFARLQMGRNGSLLDATSIPQLTVPDAVLLGAPTREELVNFLHEAARRQTAYLRTPAGRIPVETRLGCTCDDPTHRHALQPTRLEPAFAAVSPDGTPEIQADEGGAQIKFASEMVTTEPIKMGASVSAKVRFTNVGDQPLEIERVRVGCGCLRVQDWKQTLAPGATGNFIVTYSTKGREKLGAGDHVQHLWVSSNSRGRADPFYGHQLLLKVPVLAR